ncbi:MAG TPA: hypothetical protein VNF91_11220 [Candidatus Acidoferrum sp.]|nr:hypothetical protein [Candidatus Acidoferrum sp.]
MNSPEVKAAAERLNALPPELVTNSLRAAVLKAAQARATHRTIVEANSAAAAALAAGDLDGAAAAARVGGLANLPLPSMDVDPTAAAESLQRAADLVSPHRVPDLPIITYDAELGAFRSLPNGLQVNLMRPRPLLADAAAGAAVRSLAETRRAVLATIAGWQDGFRRKAEPLGLVEAAAATIRMIESYKQRHAIVAESVAKANTARAKSGFAWSPPAGLSTPEIAALASAGRS